MKIEFCLSSSCVPYVASFSVLCFVCLRLVYLMLPVSLDCVLFVFVLCALCCQFLWIVLCFCFVCLRLVYLMLPVSLDCQFLIVPSVFSNVYLNTDGEQFFQYQQNDQPPLTIKHKKTTMVLEIQAPYCNVQVQKCGVVNPVNRNPLPTP
jgi:hypothetical protein